MTVKKCKNYVILSDSEKSLTNDINPHLEIRNFGPPTRGGHECARYPEALAEGTTYVDMLPIHAEETSTTAEVSLANTLCPPLVGDRNLRFRGGQLFEKDSSQIAFAQNDCKKKKAAFTLAEGATHVDTPPTLAKAGFTLAEVLITLGIIGVVAAMTIPNLIANVKGHQYRSQFKKTLSTLSQAGLMAKAQYGFDYAGTDSQCPFGPEATDHPEEIQSFCAILNGTLTGQTYFEDAANTKDYYAYKIVDSHTIRLHSGYGGSGSPSGYHAYVLADGSIVAFDEAAFGCELPSGTKIENSILTLGPLKDCLGFIDVNGVSLPNKEVSCSDGTETYFDTDKPCIVKNDANHMTDIFPIVFHDATVEPATNAARYVLNTAK